MVRSKRVPSRFATLAAAARTSLSAYRAGRSFLRYARGRRAPRVRSTRSGPYARGRSRRFRSRRPTRLGRYVRRAVVKEASTDQIFAATSSQHPTCPSDTAYPVGWFDLAAIMDNYTSTAITSSLTKIAPSIKSYNDRFWLKDGTVRAEVSNLSNSGCVLTTYELVARRDVPNDLCAVLTTPFAAPAGVTLSAPLCIGNLFVRGLFERLPSVSGTTAAEYQTQLSQIAGDPSTTPFSSPLFCRYFKIVKVKTYRMEGGGNCVISFSSKRFRKIESDLYKESAFIRGDRAMFVGFRGVPAVDSGTENVGLTSPHLAVVKSLRVHYRSIPYRSELETLLASSMNALTTPEVMGVYTETPIKDVEL